MPVPVPSLRSLVTLRAGVVADPSRGARIPRVLSLLLLLGLVAALVACDGGTPTGPDEYRVPAGRPQRAAH